MNARIRYAALDSRPAIRPLTRLLRASILLGVWVLVGLAGLAAFARLTA